jgi:hypothetical protein
MTWHWSAAMGFALASCGGGRAVPTEVEIEWPDAATPVQPVETAPEAGADAGQGSAVEAGVGSEVEPVAPAKDSAAPPSE